VAALANLQSINPALVAAAKVKVKALLPLQLTNLALAAVAEVKALLPLQLTNLALAAAVAKLKVNPVHLHGKNIK